MCTPES
jgi:hypothetical protein